MNHQAQRAIGEEKPVNCSTHLVQVPSVESISAPLAAPENFFFFFFKRPLTTRGEAGTALGWSRRGGRRFRYRRPISDDEAALFFGNVKIPPIRRQRALGDVHLLQ